MDISETLPEAPRVESLDDAGGSARALYLCLCGARPMAEADPVDLRGLDELVLARGSAVTLTPLAARSARLTLPDPHISEPHARLTIRSDSIAVEDLQSRNGTFVDGEPVERESELVDGAVLTLGRTALLVRELGGELFDAAPALVEIAPLLRTRSPGLAVALRRFKQIAASALPVYVSGETGTGKEVAARALHELSGRTGPFIAINCGALPETIVESELFGYKRGAFSGAASDRLGLVRAAHNGTLFLDEIGDLPAAAQVKLLRVLQEHEVLPLGASTPEPVNFRLVSATHRHLATLVEEGRFRVDLWSRMRGFELKLPTLRERREDLGTLIGSLMRRHAGDSATALRFDRRAVEMLALYEWPLNVRELERVLELALGLVGPDREIRADVLEPLLVATRPSTPPPTAVRRAPDEIQSELRRLLGQHAGNVTAVARDMGHTRMQIHRWLKRFAIDVATYRR